MGIAFIVNLCHAPPMKPITRVLYALKAAGHAGPQAFLADHLDIRAQNITRWVRDGVIPEKHVAAVSALCGIPEAELRQQVP